MAPNQFGCNREWHKAGGDAVLIEIHHKTPEGKEVDHKFYRLNDGKISSPQLITWLSLTREDAMKRYPYITMLELNGAL